MTNHVRTHLILILVLLVAASAPSQTQGGVDILLAKARSLEARGSIDLAVQNWREVLLVNPNQTEALAGLARSAKQNGQIDEERSYLDRLRKINPRDPEIAAVEKLRVFKPEERNRLDEAGRLAMQHKPDEAMKIYREVLGDQQPPPGKWADPFYETEAASTGGKEKAISQLRQLCAQNPEREAYRLWLATLLTYDPKTRMDGVRMFESIKASGIVEQARAPWRQALLWEKENLDALAPIEAYLQRYPDPDLKPIAAALRARQQQNIADANKERGFKALRNKDFGDAERLFAEAHKLNPAQKDVDEGYHKAKFWGIMDQAAAALNQHHPNEAVATYQQALLLNPNDKGALLGLANASAQAGNYAEAAKTYYRLTAASPNDESSWLGLIQAQIGKKAPQAALSTAQHIPPAVKRRMEARADYLSEMALVYYGANQTAEGDQMLRRALEIARNSDTDDALGLRLQIAGAFMEQGKTGRAIEIFRQTTLSHPNTPNGWEGLVGAYTRVGDFAQAITAVRSMPEHAYDVAVTDAGFLNSVAVLYSSQGQCEEAEDFLNRSLALNQSQGRQPAEGTQLQLADIMMRERNYSRARDLYDVIVARNANSADAWRGYLVALHQQHDARTLVSEIPYVPAAVRTQLETDPSFLVLEATAYSSSGRNQDALPLLQEARSRYTAQHRNPPAVLDIQVAWTMLAVSLDETGLGNLLLNDKTRTDLTSRQSDAIEEIFSTWSVRRAERTVDTKPQLAISILNEAGHEYPSDRNIHAALAALYLKQHKKQKALDIFQSWGMAGAQAGDYLMAAGAALSAHNNALAEQFMRQGLARFPHDAELMHMTAREDIARGDYDEGERELRSALEAAREQELSDSQTSTMAIQNLQENVEARNSASAHHQASESSLQSTPSCKPDTARTTASNTRIKPIALVFTLSNSQNPAGQENSGQNPGSQAQAQMLQQELQMEDEVEAVDNRNTSIISTGGIGTERLGDPGFDRLIISDNLLGATYTASNRVRLGIEGHGVYAYSGTPNGSSTLRFGTLPAGARFGEQSNIGYSGIAQLSTNTFGIEVGTSPQGFTVHNIIGGFRYRPQNGWFTLLGVRDSVKDSLLSYAGARDPGTGIRWGGVVANTATAKVDSAPSHNAPFLYKTTGGYASVSYSFIQGLHVPDNSSVAGNAGLYWQAVQGLTVGVNATGMHYGKNLNFFSFGQGGYFSPQQYYLASIPISWYSRHPRFDYQIKLSGGVQYLHQDASVFYPDSPGFAAGTQGSYASSSSYAPNYNADIRMGYRVAPHVYLDTFATVNNAQNYFTESVGFNLRFMVNRVPTNTDLRVNSIPDWTGQQPFAIR